MPRQEPSPEDLESSRDTRFARRQLQRLEISVNYLEQAALLRQESNSPDDPELTRLIKRSRDECLKLKAQCSGRVESRRRPRRESSDSCIIFLDECGQHSLTGVDAFPVFVLSAVVVRDVDYPVVDGEWKRWKHLWFGNEGFLVHEPAIRRREDPWYGAQDAIDDLPRIISELDFVALAVVFHRGDYLADFGTGPIDVSLPDHVYLVAVDFLMERAVFALDGHFGGARARVVAESRGPKEDALVQHELSRLHLEGTSYISDAWFRQQLHPGITFLRKSENNTGLQLADLAARPIGEKVADPSSSPPRWEVFRDKLCPGTETKNSSVGLKIVPWRDRYEDVWKS